MFTITPPEHETLNVLLDDKAASALPSEYEVLTNVVTSQFKGKLGDLKETDDQQDITFLRIRLVGTHARSRSPP